MHLTTARLCAPAILALAAAAAAASVHADIYRDAVVHAGRPAEDLKRDEIGYQGAMVGRTDRFVLVFHKR